jgi:BirA family biotin operon repressor/biotin-[acetyl-CoA-carboxylase] ligase
VKLSAKAEAAGYRLLSLDVTDSTNADALRAARDGEPGALWIVASEQREGRGRHGRKWSSPRGSLYASLLLVDPCEPAVAAQLGFVAGLALHQAVQAATGIGAPRLALKWPNDLLLDGKKLAGILLEAQRVGAQGSFAVVCGFGVNVAAAPPGSSYPAICLQAIEPGLGPEKIMMILSETFAQCFALWRAGLPPAGDSFATIRLLWLERTAGIGSRVTVKLPTGERSGVFAGLDSSGRLELHTRSGPELINAGDLYFSDLRVDAAARTAGSQGS